MVTALLLSTIFAEMNEPIILYSVFTFWPQKENESLILANYKKLILLDSASFFCTFANANEALLQGGKLSC
jgi:hypothetical protein